jgi:hypothetical protein
MADVKEKRGVVELAFGIQAHKDNLFSAKIVKYQDGRISEWKQGVGTTIGHALNIAEDLMGAYAIQAHETSAEKFYNEVTVV